MGEDYLARALVLPELPSLAIGAVSRQDRRVLPFGWCHRQPLNVAVERRIHDLRSVGIATERARLLRSRNTQSDTRMIEAQDVTEFMVDDSTKEPRAVSPNGLSCVAADVDVRFDNLRVIAPMKLTRVKQRSSE